MDEPTASDDLDDLGPADGGASGTMTRRYVAALAVLAGLLGIAGWVVAALTARTWAVADLADVVCRERMLVQQAALHVTRLVGEADLGGQAAAKADLAATVDRLAAVHDTARHHLLGLGEEPRLRRFYLDGPQSVDAQVHAYLADLTAILSEPPPIAADATVRRVVDQATGRLVEGLDQAVFSVRAVGAEDHGRLHGLLAGLCGVLTLGLAAQAFLVFRPLLRRAERQARRSQDLAADLRRLRRSVDEEVARRSGDLIRARAQAEQASRAKSRFLATVGHDLLQPVKALGIFLSSLERQAAQRDRLGAGGDIATLQTARATLVDLRGALATISALIKGLLDFARAESGHLTPARRPVALAPILEQAEAEFRGMAESQGLELRIVACSALVDSDPVLLERILRNLLANALRYTVSGRVLVGCRRRGPFLRLEVHDTGPGIPEDARDRIYAAFVREPGSCRPREGCHEALGLGLAIVAELAAVLGHATGLASGGKRGGSVFWVEVPRLKDAPIREPASVSGAAAPPA